MPAAHSRKKRRGEKKFFCKRVKNGNGRRAFRHDGHNLLPQQTIRTQPADSR
jgi:hypothetical protein